MSPKRYFWNLLILVDQALNVILAPVLNLALRPEVARFGDPDETLSSVFGKNVQEGKCVGCRLACRILNWIEPGHCADAIEADRGNRAD